MQNYQYQNNLNACLLPCVGDGLSRIQGDLFVAKYANSRCSGNFVGLAKKYQLPLGVIYSEFYRFIQQTPTFPLFEKLGDYHWLEEFPMEGSAVMNQNSFKEFLKSIIFPDFTEFARDVFRDVRFTWDDVDEDTRHFTYPTPVRLPLHLVSSTSFSFGSQAGHNFLPHNVAETIDAILWKLEEPKLSSEQLAQVLRGPDFARGGTITADSQDFYSIYITGEGSIEFRCDVSEVYTLGEQRALSFGVLDVESAYKSLDSAIKSGEFPEVSEIMRRENDLLVVVKNEQAALLLSSSIAALPAFNQKLRINMRAIDGGTAKKLDLESLLQRFIDARLEFLTKVHNWSKKEAIEEFKYDLHCLKQQYAVGRKTKITLQHQ